eukprot:Skav230170  [mRNA]  locus=scaffold196:7948:19347:- [translate_table: standard]
MIVENIPMLHSMALSVSTSLSDHPNQIVSTLLALYAVASLLTSLAFFLLAYFKLERVFKILPRPVLMGCIAGMGSYILTAGLGACTGVSWEWTQVHLFRQAQHWPKLLVLLCLEVMLLFCLKRSRGRSWESFVLPLFFLGILFGSWITLASLGCSHSHAQDEGWFFKSIPSDSQMSWKFRFDLVAWRVFPYQLPLLCGIVIFSCLHVPVNVPALAHATSKQADINKELYAHGVANLFSGCCGFLQTYMVYSSSVLYHKCGGGSRITGVLVGILLILCIPAASKLISYVPRMLAGLLLGHLGVELLWESLLDTWPTLDTLEYVIVVLIAVVCNISFIFSLLFGLLCACVAFVVQAALSDPVRFAFYPGRGVRSRQLRSQRELRILEDFDQKAGFLILRLQGVLFFGNTQHSLPEREQKVRVQKVKCRAVIIDFAQVISIDSSAFSSLDAVFDTRIGDGTLRGQGFHGSAAGMPRCEDMDAAVALVESLALTLAAEMPPSLPSSSSLGTVPKAQATEADVRFFKEVCDDLLQHLDVSPGTSTALLRFFVLRYAAHRLAFLSVLAGIGKHNGSYQGKQLFTCPDGRGSFAKARGLCPGPFAGRYSKAARKSVREEIFDAMEYVDSKVRISLAESCLATRYPEDIWTGDWSAGASQISRVCGWPWTQRSRELIVWLEVRYMVHIDAGIATRMLQALAQDTLKVVLFCLKDKTLLNDWADVAAICELCPNLEWLSLSRPGTRSSSSVALSREKSNGALMESVEASGLEILPPDWTSFLDPSSFLELQCSHASSFSNAECIESFWRNLCRNEVKQLIPDASLNIQLDTDSVKHSLTRKGGLSEIASCQAQRELTKYERQRLWSKAYRDLVYDLRQTCVTNRSRAHYTSRAAPGPSGSLWMTAGNELRHDISDFRFPALLDSNVRNEEQVTLLLEEVRIRKDICNRFTSFHLRAPLGGDRCVMAKMPLPRLGVATVFPVANVWQIAWRPCSYYEVEIRPPVEKSLGGSPVVFPRRGARSECVSVGLALATIPLRGLCHQQAGWNHSSWALHGDDGQLYHSHGRGTPFRPLKNFELKGAEPQPSTSVIDLTKDEELGGALAREVPRFGQGDVVGCGVAKFQNSFGIFFTLNGRFLGVAFQFRAFAEPRLWPCVGIDATWEVAMNFGSRPFCFDPAQVIEELPMCNPQCHSLSSLLTEYPPARWPGEAFSESSSFSDDSESGTLAHGSRWSDEDPSDMSDAESDSDFVLE